MNPIQVEGAFTVIKRRQRTPRIPDVGKKSPNRIPADEHGLQHKLTPCKNSGKPM